VETQALTRLSSYNFYRGSMFILQMIFYMKFWYGL